MNAISCNTFRKSHDYYGKLVAFMTLITTQSEEEFCRCYKIASGFDKPKMEAGHQTWNMMQYGFAYWRNKEYLASHKTVRSKK